MNRVQETSSSNEGIIGRPVSRADGREKVSGRALYTADIPLKDLVHAVLVQNAIANGQVTRVESQAAEKSPGVLAVITHLNAPKLHEAPVAIGNKDMQGSAGENWLPLQDDRIHFSGQHLALVIADTLEHAQHAAALIQFQYRSERPIAQMDESKNQIFKPEKVWQEETDKGYGDAKLGWDEGSVRVDQHYRTVIQHHVTMEPHATIAAWEGDNLTIYEPSTFVHGARKAIAAWLQIAPERIRVVQHFVGGSFGCKGPVWPHVALAAIAAKRVGKPVKLTLTRQQTFTSVGYRPEIHHHIRLAATHEGRLTALEHHALAQTAVFDDRVVAPVTKTSRKIYACPNVATTYRLAHWNMPGPFTMRGPGETPGLFALESAMDELAYSLKMDPIELRLRNHADTDLEENKPWSSKHLKECYQQGADRFGWSRRKSEPRSMRDGEWLIGYGMASMAYDARSSPATARAVLSADGQVLVQSATCDQGTGSYTIMRQIASDALGLPYEKVRFDLGDTNLPFAPISAGSMTAASVGSAVQAACQSLRRKILEAARNNRESQFYGMSESDVELIEGRITVRSEPSRSEPVADFLKRIHLSEIEATEEIDPGKNAKQVTRYSFGAHFAEVRVHPDSGEVHVARYVGAFAAGRVLNAKTARSQLIGGIVWGIGMALTEETHLDTKHGRFVNADLGEYHVPVNADVPNMDVFFIEEQDSQVNPLGVKGIGEIGTVGCSAAIANAVFHASGRRIRQLPITPDKLI